MMTKTQKYFLGLITLFFMFKISLGRQKVAQNRGLDLKVDLVVGRDLALVLDLGPGLDLEIRDLRRLNPENLCRRVKMKLRCI